MKSTDQTALAATATNWKRRTTTKRTNLLGLQEITLANSLHCTYVLENCFRWSLATLSTQYKHLLRHLALYVMSDGILGVELEFKIKRPNLRTFLAANQARNQFQLLRSATHTSGKQQGIWQKAVERGIALAGAPTCRRESLQFDSCIRRRNI